MKNLLTRWDPFEALLNNNIALTHPYRKTYDIQDLDHEYVIRVDVPGVAKDDLQITWDRGYLSLQAKNTNRSYNASWSVSEKEVDLDRISAELENGVLTIKLPKNVSTIRRQIAIK